MATTSTVAATMAAAAGFDKRPATASALQTPGSGAFPSEMLSPMAASPGFLRREELRTPITPPSAYLDFLRNLSPAMLSPAPTSGGSRFGFGFVDSGKSSADTSKGSIDPDLERSLTSPPASSSISSQPSLSRNSSYASAASTNSSTSGSSTATACSVSNPSTRERPESPRVIIPNSPFARPRPPQPRRLHIPQSPRSAHSAGPGSACATPWSATFSPRYDADGNEITPRPSKVSVRQVVTRTVTYCRTPLDPAPKGKRRRIETEAESKAEHPAKAPTREKQSTPIKTEDNDDGSSKVIVTEATPIVGVGAGLADGKLKA